MEIGKKIGAGATSEIFDISGEQSAILKLFFETVSPEHIGKEFETALVIGELGIPAPAVRERVDQGGRQGIVYEKALGSSLTLKMSRHPLKLKKMAGYFADLQVAFHSKQTDRLPKQKKSIAQNISGADALTGEEKEALLAILEELPDGNTVCHGDYQPDNVMVHKEEALVLDWMTAVSGNPAADVARTLMILHDAALPETMSPLTQRLVAAVRRRFANAYWRAYSKETGMKGEQVKKWVLPIMASRLVEGVPESEKQLLLEKLRSGLRK